MRLSPKKEKKGEKGGMAYGLPVGWGSLVVEDVVVVVEDVLPVEVEVVLLVVVVVGCGCGVPRDGLGRHVVT